MCSIGSSGLTILLPIRIIYLTSLLFGAGLGFHAEWLRDEPADATATGPGSSIRGRQVPTLDPATGDMRFGMREFFCTS